MCLAISYKRSMSSSLGHCCCSERQYAGGAVYCGPPPRRPAAAAVAAAAMRHSVPLGAGPLRSQALQFVTLSVWPGLVWGGGCCDHFSIAQRLLAGLFVCVPAWLSVAGSDCLLSSAVEGGWGGALWLQFHVAQRASQTQPSSPSADNGPPWLFFVRLACRGLLQTRVPADCLSNCTAALPTTPCTHSGPAGLKKSDSFLSVTTLQSDKSLLAG